MALTLLIPKRLPNPPASLPLPFFCSASHSSTSFFFCDASNSAHAVGMCLPL